MQRAGDEVFQQGNVMKRLFPFCILALSFACCNNSYGDQNRALLIGISQYSEINSLRYADADVRAFSQLLTDFGGYQQDDVDLLLNQQATKARIVEAINKIIRDSAKHPIDHFVLMFAGHGVPGQINGEETNAFLAPFDASTDANNFYSTGKEVVNETFISKAWLARQLSAINAKSIVIILDSCYSGTKDFGKLFLENMGYTAHSYGVGNSPQDVQVAKRNLVVQQSGTALPAVTKFSNREVAYIASSRDDQPSAEYDELGHGALSYCIFEYIRKVQRSTFDDEHKELTVGDVYSNITKLFHEVKVEGKTLDSVHQPILLSIPDAESVKNLEFVSVRGVEARKANVVEKGVLDIVTDPAGVEVSVDGVKRAEVTNTRLELTAGKHLVELYMPGTSYRYSFTADISPERPLVKTVAMRGSLEVASYWLKDGQKSPGPPLDVYVDGARKGQSQLRLDNLLAGAHVLEVHYQNVTKQRQIEIRPDSPLRVNYSLIRQAAPSVPQDKGVGNVVF